MLTKAAGTRPDAFVPDLEDSVPPQEKANARETVGRCVADLAATRIPVIPRLNGIDSEWLAEDIDALVGKAIRGVSIGKVRTPDDIRRIDEMLRAAERRAGLEEGQTLLLPWIETARAVLECLQICTASPRVMAVAFGAEDLTLDMEIRRSPDEQEVSVARSLTCLAASAAGIPALDTPFFAFRDHEALARNATSSKRIGFRGKFAIHPDQIQTIHSVFSPSDEEVAEAHRIVEAFEAAARSGRGSTSLDGKVVDVPVVERARAVIRRAYDERG